MNPLDYYARKPWNVPRALEKTYHTEAIEELLYILNQFQNGSFYMLDYYRFKIIVDSPVNLILSGYPKESAYKEGMDFFRQIMNKSRYAMYINRDKEFFNIFFRCQELYRRNLVCFSDIVIEDINHDEHILHHKMVPYKLDKNGNIWLALCFCQPSTLETENNHSLVTNTITGERYEFMGGSFVLSDTNTLDEEELLILKWMVKELSAEQICDLLKVSESSLKRKKQRIYAKLGVITANGAIHKAHIMNII